MGSIEERLARVEEKTDNVKDMVKDLHVKFDKLDEKYSGKWVERVAIAAILLSIGALITG